MEQRRTPHKSPIDSVWVDCFFYGFYLKKDQVHLWQFPRELTNVKPLDVTPKTFEVVSGHKMKRADTTREHLDKAGSSDGLPVSAILQMIDSDDKDTETKPLLDKKRRHDDVLHAAIVDYAISTGASGVQYVMDTLSGVLNK